ncbi:hypothetical protein GCM10010520_54090 [Rhizobium viscosum]|uniref:Uncharacterized protein n=1 Tax=Rhizobium viscosum TaxID=1673 RepID=A0ABR9J083_RHIVS|nr:hypothetical protein [Rhizobium viscosum]MBE1508791.1 hypothetical protein [Rhizobium viscosum]
MPSSALWVAVGFGILPKTEDWIKARTEEAKERARALKLDNDRKEAELLLSKNRGEGAKSGEAQNEFVTAALQIPH